LHQADLPLVTALAWNQADDSMKEAWLAVILHGDGSQNLTGVESIALKGFRNMPKMPNWDALGMGLKAWELRLNDVLLSRKYEPPKLAEAQRCFERALRDVSDGLETPEMPNLILAQARKNNWTDWSAFAAAKFVCHKRPERPDIAWAESSPLERALIRASAQENRAKFFH
jgi:hypothetical protein